MIKPIKFEVELADYDSVREHIHLTQYDRGFNIEISILEHGLPYTLQNDEAVQIDFELPKNSGYILSKESIDIIDSNTISFAVNRNITLNFGIAKFNVAIIDKTTGITKKKSTNQYTIDITQNALSEDFVSEELIVSAKEKLDEKIYEAGEVTDTLQQAIETGDLDKYALKTEVNTVKSDLTKKVDGIQIGARNYLLNTGLKDNTSSFSGLNNEVTRVTTKKTPSGNNCFYTKLSNKTNKVWRGATQEITSGFSIGDTMTFSIQTYVTNEIATDEGLFVEVVGLASDNSTRTFTVKKQVNASVVNKWVKYELTFVVPKNTVKLQCLSYVVKNGSWYTGDYKLEKGNKATDWSPNPKDIDTAITTKTETLDNKITTKTATLDNKITTTKTELKKLISDTALATKKALHPVNSIYLSMDSTNPNTLFGFGTWQLIGQGRTLVGVDTSDNDLNTENKTGGSKTHTMTIEE